MMKIEEHMSEAHALRTPNHENDKGFYKKNLHFTIALRNELML